MSKATLEETRAALRHEIGPPTVWDGKWQPMVSAGEIRQLLDALDKADAEADRAAETLHEAWLRIHNDRFMEMPPDSFYHGVWHSEMMLERVAREHGFDDIRKHEERWAPHGHTDVPVPRLH